MNELCISVVVPTYNREARLCETIRSLLELKSPDWELLIIDQSLRHRPETESFLSHLPPFVRIFKLHKPNLPAARNKGIIQARGKVILYLDDDVTPSQDLLNAHLRHYGDSSVGGVAGSVLPPSGEVRPLDARYFTSPLPWLYIRYDQAWGLREIDTAPGNNMSFRRELLLKVGGFDENFQGNAFREETDFCLRLRKLQLKIVFDPEALVIHHFCLDGGCGNRSTQLQLYTEYLYYINFIHNNIYFFLKHVPFNLLPGVLWNLYRDHAGNRPVMVRGIGCTFVRHFAFLLGIVKGYRTWKAAHSLVLSEKSQNSP